MDCAALAAPTARSGPRRAATTTTLAAKRRPQPQGKGVRARRACGEARPAARRRRRAARGAGGIGGSGPALRRGERILPQRKGAPRRRI
eukprot:scaffold421_cov382-Prasinococcus_capsulatus_cf.AAC.2